MEAPSGMMRRGVLSATRTTWGLLTYRAGAPVDVFGAAGDVWVVVEELCVFVSCWVMLDLVFVDDCAPSCVV